MGKVQHFEIPADDIKRADEFYKKAFDWNIVAWDDEYHVVHTGPTDKEGMTEERGFINGGIQKRSDIAPVPTVVVMVDNLDKKLEQIKELGGEVIMPKIKIENMLFYARIKDTEGNIIGVGEEIE